MELNTALFISLSILCLYFVKLFLSRQENLISRLPPGPKPWPIIGNALLLSGKPHRSFASLAKLHGPLMSIKIKGLTTIIVTSVDVAREVFQKHDLAFSRRPTHDAARANDHHKYSVTWLPVSPKWQSLRKICSVHLFAKQSLDSSAIQLLRKRKVGELLEHVGECARKARPVEVYRAAFTATLNSLSNTFFSIDLASYRSASSTQDFKDLLSEITEVLAKPNLVDLFPVLRYFDPQGIRRDAETLISEFLDVIDGIIKQRLCGDEPSSSSSEDDVLAMLLKIFKQDGSDLSLDDIKHLILDLFLAGTTTTSATIEWAMTELIRNPKAMAKAQSELDEILGKDGSVQESDIARLPYLQAVVKETLRLHPPGPLMGRKAVADVGLLGYAIPRGSRLVVNVWAMGRDPATWQDPEAFSPERFLGSTIDFKGQDFELITFGVGRRICPGLPLAYRMVHLVLSTLLYSYDWKLRNEIGDEDVDMTEKVGIALRKAKPLLAVPMAK